MQNVPTIEEFWAAFTKSQEKAAKDREEWNRRIAEAEEEAAKDRGEWNRRIAEAEEEVKRNKAEWLAAQREAERTVDRVGKQMGDLNNRFGELAEHLVAPGIVRHFNEQGYRFGEAIAGRLTILDGTGRNILTEIDLLLENGEYSIAVEVKSRPTLKDVVHHERRLKILREYKDRKKDPRKIRGGIAGAVFPAEVKEAVIEAGMYVIEQSGDTMKISVPEGFKPREW
jgi:hypothetical protein